MDVFVVGEDDACKAIIYRVIDFCCAAKGKSLRVVSELPARGGEIKNKIKNFNILSVSTPVILLTDLDNNTCPPAFIATLMGGDVKNENFVLSIAVDEVEAWLLADRGGFARYFDVDVALIPNASRIKMQGRVEKTEIDCKCKTSLYFTSTILPNSRNKSLIEQLTPRYGATKGPEYNTVMVPFIRNSWNIEEAMQNSDSLKGMINRIFRLIDNH
jgi:hypothetical protein